MMVNPDMHGYAKTLNHREILRKTQKSTTYWKPKPQYKLSGDSVFTFSLPRGRFASLPCQLRHCCPTPFYGATDKKPRLESRKSSGPCLPLVSSKAERRIELWKKKVRDNSASLPCPTKLFQL